MPDDFNLVTGADTITTPYELAFQSAETPSVPALTITAPASAAPWYAAVPSITNGLASIGNSVANIFRASNPNPTAGYYNAAGQFVPILAPQAPALGGTSIATAGGNIGSLISQLLPIVLIVAILGFVISLFGHKRK